MILAGKLSPDHVTIEAFAPPYDDAIKRLREGADISTLYDTVGLLPIKSALDAEKAMGSMLPAEAVKLLDKAWSREELAKVLDKQITKLRRGEDADLLKITGAIERNISLEHRYTTADLITPEEAIWIKTGYAPWDQFIGGIPASSLTIIPAPPGTGKTSLLLKLAASMNKKCLIYTFEMTQNQLVKRLLDIAPNITMEQRRTIQVCDDILEVDEVVAEASRIASIEQLGMIGIDFADLMLNQAEEESSVAMLYRSMARLAKNAKVPVVLLSQLNRQYAERGGEPRITDIRWSGLAEAMAALIVLIYNPNQVHGAPPKRDSLLRVIPGKGYLILGKSRYGCKMGGIGAILVDWNGVASWGDEGSWQSLVSV